MPDFRGRLSDRLSGARLSARRRAEIVDEMAAHLEDCFQAALARGCSATDAEAAAWREVDADPRFAWTLDRTEQAAASDVRAAARFSMQTLLNDLRAAFRSIRRLRGATALAVLAFALGIGITTAVFSVFYGVLLKPLPYPDADRIAVVYDVQPGCKTCPASYPKYVDWRTRNTVFEEIAGLTNGTRVLTNMGDAERISVGIGTWTLPAVLRTTPILGRWFTEKEDTAGGDRVAVLGYEMWRDRFGADRAALGRTLTLDGQPYTVIGVMPQDFLRTSTLFVPLQRAFDPATRGNHFLPVLARLKPGVTLAQAQKDMVALGHTLAKEYGYNHGIDVQSYVERSIGSMRDPLRLLLGAVLLVLLIACANIANLLLASGAARKREFAVRAAIGATRVDLLRQVLAESVALALIGGALGLGLAEVCVSFFVKLADTVVPRAATVSIDVHVLLFALGVSLATGVFCALWPALRLNPVRLAAAVREGDVRGGTDPSARRFGHALVVAEVALAFTLLVGSGLLLKNLLRLESRPIGFRTEHVIAFDLPVAKTRYPDDAAVAGFYDALLPKLRAIPGVMQAAATSHLPMYNFGWNGEVAIEGGNPWAADAAPLVERAWITHDYFTTLGIPIRAGRAFDDRDRAHTPPVAILTKGTADRFWPGQDPIGKRFSRAGNPGTSPEWTTVVGIVDDARSYGLQAKPPLQLYSPAEQEPFGAMSIVLRVAGDDVSAPLPAVRAAVKEIDPSMPVAKVQTLESVVEKSVSQPRLISSLTVVFGTMAGILAAVGVYGVMAYNVRRDRRQFAIRLALGADPSIVRRAILGRGLLLGAAGVVLGTAGAWLLTRYMASMLSDVTPTDPMIFSATAVTLLAVAIAACVVPALQAGKTDPMTALRGD